jgi:xylulokinase
MELVDPGLPACLPDLLGPNDVVGTLLPEVAQQLGLPPDVVVGPGSGDNACSALGSGVAQAGQLVVSLGTSGTIFGKSAVPIIDRSGAVCPFCDATGAWLPLVCTLNCTVPAEEVRGSWGRQLPWCHMLLTR